MPKSIWRSWKSSYFHEDVLNSPKVYTAGELRRIRREGHTGIWVHGLLREISRSDVFPDLNRPENDRRIDALRCLTERAASHGLDVYIYLVEPRCLDEKDPFWEQHPDLAGTRAPSAMLEFPVGRALCTSQPLVFDFLENAAGNLFTLVPRLKGFLLITASEHLHHCLSFSTPVYPELYEKQYANLCPKCRDRDATAMVSSIVNRLAQGAYHARPDAEIIAWNWDWSWYDAAPYEKIIRQLDPRISLATNLNLRGTKEDPVGTRRRINEYALSYVGPSEHCQKCAEFARNSGRKFFVQMVLGTTHELATVPCIPVPHRVYEKVVEARRLNAEGYLGWTFGSMPCVNLAVAARVRSLPSIPENKEDFLRCFAAEYLPGCNADLVCKAWRFFAMGIDLYPFDNRLLYYGPVNYALAYKQFPGPVLGKPMTQSWLDLPREGDDLDSCCGPFSPEILIERFDLMADRFEEGVAYYRKGTKNVAEPRKSLELGNAAIIALIFRSVANIFRIHMLKKAWAPSQARAFRRILKDELAICRKALPLVKADSRLGFHTECQAYQFSEALIRGKIRHICDLLPS